MNGVGRQNRGLLVGLVIALIVLIARPVQQFLDIAHDVDHVLGLSLLPAFVVLTVALILHWQAKSYEAKSAGQTAEARGPHRRAAPLPALTESDDVWVLTRAEQGWRALNGTTTAGRADLAQTHAHIAERALKG